jgi:hypothetical protein
MNETADRDAATPPVQISQYRHNDPPPVPPKRPRPPVATGPGCLLSLAILVAAWGVVLGVTLWAAS